jgi:hypothetical protein
MFDLNTILILAGAAAAFGYFKGKKNDATDTSGDIVDDAKREVIKKELSYSASWYSQNAEKIKSYLQTAYRSNDSIHQVLLILSQLKTKSDWLYLVSKFGLQSGVTWGAVWNEPLNVWIVQFLKDRTYEFSVKEQGYKINALKAARNRLDRINVTI